MDTVATACHHRPADEDRVGPGGGDDRAGAAPRRRRRRRRRPRRHGRLGPRRATRPGQYRSDLAADAAALAVLDARRRRRAVRGERAARRPDGESAWWWWSTPSTGRPTPIAGVPWYATSLCAVDGDGPLAAVVADLAARRALRGGARRWRARRDGAADRRRPRAPTLGRRHRRPVGLAAARTSAGRQYRALGAAALDLCAVAAGVLDGYVDCSRRRPRRRGTTWAALLVCREAGAVGGRRPRPRARRARPRRPPHAGGGRHARRCSTRSLDGAAERSGERAPSTRALLRVFRRLPPRLRLAAVHAPQPVVHGRARCASSSATTAPSCSCGTATARAGACPGGLCRRGEEVADGARARGARGGRRRRRAPRRAGRRGRPGGAPRRRRVRGPPGRRRRSGDGRGRCRPRSWSAGGSPPAPCPSCSTRRPSALAALARRATGDGASV